MTLQDRSAILHELGAVLEAPVLAYVTGDRPGLEAQISPDQVPRMPRHLKALAGNNRLALLIYTRGGDTNTAWPVANFVRANCQELLVLVPFFAHSSGTLLALAADRIVMTPYSTLSPIDPTVANAFNPQDGTKSSKRLPIAVEDVLAFRELVNTYSEAEEVSADAFRRLADAVHPLALGNVQRSINQIRQLAKKMLALHGDPRSDEEQTAIINRLTTELYSHQHLITRTEAREIGLPVEDADQRVEELLTRYHDSLIQDLELLERFDPPRLLRQAQAAGAPTGGTGAPSGAPAPQQGTTPPGPAAAPFLAVRAERAYIETKRTCDAFVTSGTVGIQLVPAQGQPGAQQQQAVAFEITQEGWETVR